MAGVAHTPLLPPDIVVTFTDHTTGFSPSPGFRGSSFDDLPDLLGARALSRASSVCWQT
jgi:hypothetical protein